MYIKNMADLRHKYQVANVKSVIVGTLGIGADPTELAWQVEKYSYDHC